MDKMQCFGTLWGRICLSAIFILAGVGKIFDFQGTADYMASKGMCMVPVFLVGAILVEVLGGLSILLGCKARYGAGALALFLIPVTYIFHNFWTMEPGMERMIQMQMFLKNLAIYGGLVYVWACGPGSCSCDGRCEKK